MIRSAAKNFKDVAVVSNPNDYSRLIEEWQNEDGISYGFRKELSQKVFQLMADYNLSISNYLKEDFANEIPSYDIEKSVSLRYGENPHQKAKFYNDGSNRKGLITSHQIQGKELSYNNINDTNAAFELVSEFDDKKDFAVAIIKHANPCGVATGSSLIEAYSKALNCDSVSAFGGIIALNKGLDKETATKISEIFTLLPAEFSS